jgi:hypothetical protein
MAITITAAPPTDSCLNDDIWVTCSSTNSGTTNFKFVFDIKVGGALLSRSKVFPNPTDSKGYFNTAPIELKESFKNQMSLLLTEWIDYIPVKAVTNPSNLTNSYAIGGNQFIFELASITGLQAGKDYINIYYHKLPSPDQQLRDVFHFVQNSE